MSTLLLTGLSGKCQFLDSLSVSATVLTTGATRNYQPLWITANKFGVISDKQLDMSSQLNISNKNELFKFGKTPDYAPVEEYNAITISYGLNFVNYEHFTKTFAEQAFVKLEYKNWSLRYGRFEEILGDVDRDLSTGSLGVSGNAVPIPKIGVALTDYTNVPFTNGWLKIKGSFAHGWFGNNRYMHDAFYHEKTLYMSLGPGRFRLYGGLQHYAEWGGIRGNLHLDRSFKGFLNVLFVRQADDGSVGTAINGIAPSRAGDQRGLIEAGFYLETDKVNLHGYAQMPFESGEEIDPKNRSFLSGLSIVAKDSWLTKFVAEIMYTKSMNNFVGVKQRNSYYNNGEYKTGWEYDDRIIGTPLFMNRTVASHYFPQIQPFDWSSPDKTIPGNANIVDNRITAFHLGANYNLNEIITGKTLLTYSRNYGTYKIDFFTPAKVQYYTLQEFDLKPQDSKWTFKACIGLDFGDLNTVIGSLIGITYQLR